MWSDQRWEVNPEPVNKEDDAFIPKVKTTEAAPAGIQAVANETSDPLCGQSHGMTNSQSNYSMAV